MKRRPLIILAVIVVLLFGLLFAADRGVQALAERRVADEVQASVGSAQTPSVDLGSFPFLTEVATGRVQTAHVRLAEAELPDSSGATATDIDATFTDIRLSDGYTQAVAASGQATGLLSYASLSKLTGLKMAYAGPDRVSVDFSMPLGRLTVAGTATGRPVLNPESQSLTVEDAEVSVPDAEADQGLVEAAGRLVLRRPYPVGALPYNLRATGLTVTETGIRFAATGQDIPLR